MNFNKIDKKISYSLLLALIISLLLMQIWPSRESSSTLDMANTDISESIDVPIYVPNESSILSKQDIKELRDSYLSKLPLQLVENYEPRESIFSKIKDEAHWLSKQNYYFYGPNQASNSGSSVESLALANPILLIYPDFAGWSIRGALQWNKDAVIEQQALNQESFPFVPEPKSINIQPNDQTVSVIYNLTDFQNETERWLLNRLDLKDLSINLISYNARDFGYDYYKISAESVNISSDKADSTTFGMLINSKNPICGSSETGCNHRVQLGGSANIKISALPAVILLDLFKVRPDDDTQQADLKFKIILN